MAAPSGARRPVYPPVYFLGAAIVMIALHRWAPVRQIIPPPFRYVGVGLMLAGFLMDVGLALRFRRAGTTIKPFQESSALIVDGPYRYTRNPIYLGMVCGLTGFAVLAGSLTPFLVVPVFAMLIDRRFIRGEEAVLARKFGSEYDAYRARVRRWI